MIHAPLDRHFFLVGGNVMTTGNSLNLARGQVGLFDLENPTKDGLKAVNSLAGVPKTKEFVLKLGTDNSVISRTHNIKSNSSHPFSLEDVVAVRVSAPQKATQNVDEVVFGYNGIDPTTSINFAKGDKKTIYLRLSGNWIGLLGYPDNYVDIEYTMFAEECPPSTPCEDCDDCADISSTPIILKAIEFLKNFELRGGIKVSDAVDITPVKSCTEEPNFITSDYTYQTLTVADSGDDNALALVRAQYPGYTVTRKDIVKGSSVYEILAPAGTTLSDYSQGIASILKGCEDCPTDFTATEAGVLYHVSIQDNGTDLSTTVDNLPGYVAGTVSKNGNNSGVGFYSLVLDNELTAAEVATFVTANPTAIVQKIGDVTQICENGDVTTVSWVAGATCKVSEEAYTLVVPDTECGQNRLAEIQSAYPNNTVYVNGTSSRAVTLTGTSGTGNVVIGGVNNYLVTFNTDLTTTAANFVTTHAAAILAATGATVTAAAGVITVVDNVLNFPTIAVANVSGDLAGTIGNLTSVTTVTGGCSTEYIMSQPTNIVCNECSDIFKDTFVSAQPANYDVYTWKKVENTPNYSTDCLSGIKFKGKEFLMVPDEFFRDEFAFEESAIKIQVSGGYISEVSEGRGVVTDSPIAVTYLSRWSPRTHILGNMINYEDESRMFFTGEDRHDTPFSRVLAGDSTHIQFQDSQAVDIAIEIRKSGYSNSLSNRESTTNIYHIVTELGKHQAALSLANLIAAGAGLPAVTI